MKNILLTSVLMMFSNFAAGEPLPETSEVHFFAIVNCGEVLNFSWYTPDGGVIMPVGKITSQEILDNVLEARDKAEEDGNAYVIRVGEDCHV